MKRLQSVQNAAARLVSGARRQDHITPVLRSLHWLPVRRMIFFKTAVLVWKCIHDVAPAYLQEVCLLAVESVPGRPRLRSASSGCVELPRVLTSTGQRSFNFHGPTVWNSLPSALRDDSLSRPIHTKRVYVRRATCVDGRRRASTSVYACRRPSTRVCVRRRA